MANNRILFFPLPPIGAPIVFLQFKSNELNEDPKSRISRLLTSALGQYTHAHASAPARSVFAVQQSSGLNRDGHVWHLPVCRGGETRMFS